jgi:ABC-type Na+ efflux pump permease subunit
VYQKGINYTPRYNIPITKNKLLFIANGDGDYKKPFIDINSETLEKEKKEEKQAIIREKKRIEKQLKNGKLTHGEAVEKLAIEDEKQEQLEQINDDSIKKFIFANVEDLELTEEKEEKELYKYAFFSQNQELLEEFLVKN